MSLSTITDDISKLSKLKIEVTVFLIIISSIFILIDIFIYHNDLNIGKITFNEIRAIWYVVFFISVSAYCIQKILYNIKKQEYFNIIKNLDAELVEILECFALANSNIAEIKNNCNNLIFLEQAGFIINCISELYDGNIRTIDGKVYSDLMVKAKLENNEVLPYIREYFKKKNKF